MRERLRHTGRRLPVLAERSLASFFGHRGTQSAAAISYYALLSIFPIAILMVGLFGLVADDQAARQRIIDFMLRNLPLNEQAGRRDLEDLLTGVTGNVGALSAVAAAGLVFTASGLMGAVRSALNTAWGVEDRRPPLQGKLLDVLLVLGVGILIALSAAITIVTRVAASLGDRLEEILGSAGSALPRLLLELGPLPALALAFITFAFLYRVVPATDVRLLDVWVAALGAAAAYELAKLAFAGYLDSFGNYNAVYGSIGAVVAFAVFMFLAANVFLLGAEASAEWTRLRDEELQPGPPLRRKLRDFVRGLAVRPSQDGAGGSGRGER